MAAKSTNFTWGGRYDFRVNGSGLHEDTLRILSSYRKQEQMLKLVLPTLCITYADAAFQDQIGGEQRNYPASKTYGPLYFNPPVEINGEKEIERLTYIRGAGKVLIGTKETTIVFPSWKELIIPRLRIDQKMAVKAGLHVPVTTILQDEPLKITVRQYADGRHIGGVSLEKRHPDWIPPKEKERYNLWIRVINGHTLQPLPEVKVEIFRWDPKVTTPYGNGGFVLERRIYTDNNGCIQQDNRPSGRLNAFVVSQPGYRSVVRCLRPMTGQNVRFHMRVWQLKEEIIPYVWNTREKLEKVIGRTGHSLEEFRKLNNLKSSFFPKLKMKVKLPCWFASYQPEPWDNLDWVGKTFGYEDAKGLAEANGLKNVSDLATGTEIKLPDWHFFYAQEGDTLEKFDKMFGLPKGSSITVGRVFHPDPRLPYPGETVAVPNP